MRIVSIKLKQNTNNNRIKQQHKIADLCILISSVFCESDLCRSRSGFPNPVAHWSSEARGACGGAGFSASFCLCLHLAAASESAGFPFYVPIPIFAWIFIFLLVALQSQLPAVIYRFEIHLTSSLPLSGSLKCSPSKHLSASLCFGWCPAAEHALLSGISILSTCNMGGFRTSSISQHLFWTLYILVEIGKNPCS